MIDCFHNSVIASSIGNGSSSSLSAPRAFSFDPGRIAEIGIMNINWKTTGAAGGSIGAEKTLSFDVINSLMIDS